MSLLSRSERRLGRFAIPNLTTILVVGQAMLWVAAQAPEGVSLDRIALDPTRVAAGEVWRLATFLFTPPANRSILVIFYFLLFYRFGTTLEYQWGARAADVDHLWLRAARRRHCHADAHRGDGPQLPTVLWPRAPARVAARASAAVVSGEGEKGDGGAAARVSHLRAQ
jgi:hypothetical protein